MDRRRQQHGKGQSPHPGHRGMRQFLYLLPAKDEFMVTPDMDHFGMEVSSKEELLGILERVKVYQEQGRPGLGSPMWERWSPSTTATEHTLTNVYIRFLIPLWIELQHIERRSQTDLRPVSRWSRPHGVARGIASVKPKGPTISPLSSWVRGSERGTDARSMVGSCSRMRSPRMWCLRIGPLRSRTVVGSGGVSRASGGAGHGWWARVSGEDRFQAAGEGLSTGAVSPVECVSHGAGGQLVIRSRMGNRTRGSLRAGQRCWRQTGSPRGCLGWR